MTRFLPSLLFACVCVTATSTAMARDVQRQSVTDAIGCSPDLAAAKAEAGDAQEEAPARAAKPASPVRSAPTVRGSDAAVGTRLNAPRWHSFLPGMFR